MKYTIKLGCSIVARRSFCVSHPLVEMFFSILKNSFNTDQNLPLKDYINNL